MRCSRKKQELKAQRIPAAGELGLWLKQPNSMFVRGWGSGSWATIARLVKVEGPITMAATAACSIACASAIWHHLMTDSHVSDQNKVGFGVGVWDCGIAMDICAVCAVGMPSPSGLGRLAFSGPPCLGSAESYSTRLSVLRALVCCLDHSGTKFRRKALAFEPSTIPWWSDSRRCLGVALQHNMAPASASVTVGCVSTAGATELIGVACWPSNPRSNAFWETQW